MMMNKRPEFTQEQIDFICYQIGEWYLDWKPCLVDWQTKNHRLGYAKEKLKTMICGDVNDSR
ncbi:TPA: hypothetical protein JBL19_06180 [Legionella pneumophila]|nr:hypothetical protein [Legionella pneumophila subsp. fraseri]HAT1796289.1 hypothetical protein [Legionella pneumophila]MDW9041799.1 hypothetical protein [Legionella pneumophila subsp. fraseri]HAT1905361.1 hypothetical protein [Legionella pneumophila]HAT3891706.1 hypothetical protein [Legionella pneumophila]